MRILSVLIVILFFTGCNSHAYYDEAKIYLADAQKVLIKKGVCTDNHDCTSRSIVKYEAGGWELGPWSGGGVSINVYGITDTVVAEALNSQFLLRKKEIPEAPVHLRVYSSKHNTTKIKIAEYAYQ